MTAHGTSRRAVNPTSGSLVYVVAMDFDEREIPEEVLQLVEGQDWSGWGVGKEWPTYARQEKSRKR